MVRQILVRSANFKVIDKCFNTLLALRKGFGKGDIKDGEEGKERHERASRTLFLHKQRRGYRNWSKFIEHASETYDEYQLQKLQQKQAEKLDR